MFRRINLCLIACATLQAAEITNRQPETPAWQIDLTDRLTQLADDPVSDGAGRGLSILEVFNRPNRGKLLPAPDVGFGWQVPVALPSQADSDWPVVVEWDESRLVTKVRYDRGELPKPSGWTNRWNGGEGATLLPLTKANPSGVLSFRAQWLDQLYDNGFGRVRLRPAEFEEALALDKGDSDVTVRNRSALPFDLKVYFRAEDFFGTPLAEDEVSVNVKPASQESLKLPINVTAEGKAGATLYKIRIHLETAGRKSPEYWWLRNSLVENRARPEVARQKQDWEATDAPEGFDKPAPETGWKNIGAAPCGTRSKSPTVWMRTTLEIPKDWKSERVQLWLANVSAHAKIFIDGKLVAERSSWDLPDVVTLPLEVKPGGKHELLLGVTAGSRIARLPGEGDRKVTGPMNGGAGIAMVELLGVPAVRTQWTFIRTRTVGAKALNATLEIANDGNRDAIVSPTVKLIYKGELALSKSLPSVRIPAGKTVIVETGVINVPDAKLWSPETPELYEFRVELPGDVRRDRFGFRQFEKQGGHFTLNGERINPLGSSHFVPFESVAWPARPFYSRMVRYYYTGGEPTLMAGNIGINLSEEMGIPIKIEIDGMNALHRPTYAFQEEILWQRMEATLRSYARNFINHAGLLFWDYGNELNFQGPGEAERMNKAYQAQRKYDPTRLVTNSGGIPNLIPGAEVYDRHGWPYPDSRRDWFFLHPEDRPAYLREGKKEVYAVLPAGGNNPDVDSIEGQATFFSEGHYYENGVFPELTSSAGWVNLEGRDNASLHVLSGAALRKQTVQSARVAGFPAQIIHVDRSVGRWAQPLIAASVDRRTRFTAGEKMQTRQRVLHDLAGSRQVSAKWTLFDGEKAIATKDWSGLMAGGAFADVELDFPLPARNEDRDYRLNVEVRAAGYAGYFRDDIIVTAFASRKAGLPAGQELTVFDPEGSISKYLESQQVKFSRIPKIADWAATPNNTLLVGFDALSKADPAELPVLRAKVNSGGRVIVLDHRSLPGFLSRRFTQSPDISSLAYSGGPSAITDGLLTRDFQYWNTRDKDWISVWKPLEIPASGLTRMHVRSRHAPVLEVAEGRGRVVFCQLNLRAALGVEPAADRIFQNLLHWTGEPSPFAIPGAEDRTLIVFTNLKRLVALRGRMGLEGTVTAKPTIAQILAAKLIVLDGEDPSVLADLDSAAVKTAVEAGANLFVQKADADSAKWISTLSGVPLGVEPYALPTAYLNGYSPITSGLSHDSLFAAGMNLFGGVDGIGINKPGRPENDSLAHTRLTGNFHPLTIPSFIGEVALGKGRVVVNQTRNLDYAVRKQALVFTTLVANLGGRFTADGITGGGDAVVRWSFTPLDLAKQAVDVPALFDFPKGRQTLAGVDHVLASKVVAIGGKSGASEVKGIPVGCKADRLHFLHAAAGGIPAFIYRVYYAEDRRIWIPGMPPPYVDVEVKPEAIAEFRETGKYARGEAFLGGAAPAWKGKDDSGFYQMTWDNPAPDKAIESVDLLLTSPPEKGAAFLFAITAAHRLDAEAPAGFPKPSIKNLLPEAQTGDVFEQWQNDRYGLILLRDGSIPVIYKADGKPLVKVDGWNFEGDGQKFDAGENLPTIRSSITADGNQVFEITQAPAKLFTWSQRILCSPSGIRVDYSFVPNKTIEGNHSVNLAVKVLQPLSNDIGAPLVHPIEALTDLGAVTFNFDPRVFHWYTGYGVWGEKDRVWFNAGTYTEWKKDQPITFWIEIGL